jgi:transcriptional regulator NrdR family protein
MNCRNCGTKTSVYDSRPSYQGIRRRRQCPKCLHRATSIETWEIEVQKTEAHKPQLVPSPHLKKKTRPRKASQKVSFDEIAHLTDEQVEDLIMSGSVKFDEDEL